MFRSNSQRPIQIFPPLSNGARTAVDKSPKSSGFTFYQQEHQQSSSINDRNDHHDLVRSRATTSNLKCRSNVRIDESMQLQVEHRYGACYENGRELHWIEETEKSRHLAVSCATIRGLIVPAQAITIGHATQASDHIMYIIKEAGLDQRQNQFV